MNEILKIKISKKKPKKSTLTFEMSISEPRYVEKKCSKENKLSREDLIIEAHFQPKNDLKILGALKNHSIFGKPMII